jgi:peptidoglycan/LPS O-acetylase OafA/YrhL
MVQSWSLATEIAFYALLPVLAFAIGALARRTRNVMASELGVCAALVALGIGVNGWLARSRPEGTVASVWLPAQIHLFALGMLLAVAAAWALHRGGDAALERLARPAWLWWTVAALAYWCVAVELHLPTSFDQPTSFGKAVAKTVLYAVVAFCVVAPCALMGDGPGRLRRFLSWRTARGLGLISYGIFLWHLDVIRELEDHGVFSVTSPITGAGTFDPAGDGARFLLVCAWTVALTIALAAIMWRLLERPLQRLAHSRPKRSPTA